MSLPFALRLERRLSPPRWLRWGAPVLSVLAALLLGAAALQLAGLDALRVYAHLFRAAFVGAWALSDTAVKATPILLCGLGVALAFRARLWNIGAEGQLLLGAWAAAGVALHLLPANTPAPLMLGTMALAGFAAGAVWGGLAGVLRARLGVNEVVTTLILNYVAAHWIAYFVFGPWSEGGFQLTPQFPPSAWMPRLADGADAVPALSGLTVHAGLLLGLLAAVLLSLWLSRTPTGFEIRAIGGNPAAARYAGMDVARTTTLVMILSGGLAGLAGMSEVSGVVHRLQDRFSPGYGFTGVIVAWLAKLDPVAIVPVSILFGGLLVGGKEVQPAGIAQLLQGLILFVVTGAEILLRYRVRVERRRALDVA